MLRQIDWEEHRANVGPQDVDAYDLSFELSVDKFG